MVYPKTISNKIPNMLKLKKDGNRYQSSILQQILKSEFYELRLAREEVNTVNTEVHLKTPIFFSLRKGEER